MKKQFTHLEMSDQRCIICGKLLKANVVARKPGALYCYKHSLDRRKKHQARVQ